MRTMLAGVVAAAEVEGAFDRFVVVAVEVEDVVVLDEAA
jgi:hypothetical protein